MPNPSITKLLLELERTFSERITLYGAAPDEEHGTAFRVAGIPAVFSVVTNDGTLPADEFDVQIESHPPGEYIYTAQLTLTELMSLVPKYAAHPAFWPETESGG